MRSASLLTLASILTIAESGGLRDVPDEVTTLIAPEVELKLREVVQVAAKLRKGARRNILSMEDFKLALSLKGADKIYGHGSLIGEDRIRESLRISGRLNRDALEGSVRSTLWTEPTLWKDALPKTFRKISGEQGLYVLQDKEYGCCELLDIGAPKVPVEGFVSAHWLAIEGIQPRTPENPVPGKTLDPFAASLREGDCLRQGQISASLNWNNSTLHSTYFASFRPIVKNVLSRELQLYFEKICLLLRSNRLGLRKAATDSIAGDPGIQPLVPYFCQYVSIDVTHRMDDLQTLEALATLMRALVLNPFLNVEPYLHQLMPPIITLIIGARLGRGLPTDDHWKLRDFCSSLLALICKRFRNSFRSMKPRLLRTITRVFLDPSRPIPALYGATRALTFLGSRVVCEVVAPHVNQYCTLISRGLRERQGGNRTNISEMEHLRNALGEAMGRYASSQKLEKDDNLVNQFSTFFGKSFLLHFSRSDGEILTNEEFEQPNDTYENPFTYAFPINKEEYAKLSESLVI